MSQDRELSSILDECLERLLLGGETMEDCLTRYPERAAELRPLLETALAAKQALNIEPRPQFRTRARSQFHTALQEAEARRGRPLFAWRPRWAAVMASLVLALLITAGGVVAAANNSMPDEFLYPIKLTTEQVLLKLSPSALIKAKLFVKLADRRVAEIIYLAQKGDARQVELVTQRLDDHLTMIASLAAAQRAGGDALLAPSGQLAPETDVLSGGEVYNQADDRAELVALLGYYAVSHPAALSQALETASDSVRVALYQAITISVAGYQRALDAIEQGTGQ